MKKIFARIIVGLLLLLSWKTALAQEIPKDVSYLLGMYYGNGSQFLIRENQGRLELVYRFDGDDKDFSGSNVYPLKKEHFDSYTINEVGPIMGTEAAVRFERDSDGRGITCSVGGKRFSRYFYPGQKDNENRFPSVNNADQLAKAAAEAVEPPALQKGTAAQLVNLAAAVPNLKVDLRYGSANNLFGRPLYEGAKAYASTETAAALKIAAQLLNAKGYGLLVWEAYRPWSASKLAYDLLPADGKGMLPAPEKGDVHNTGLAVDVSLYDLKTGLPLPMISDYDEISPRQYPHYAGSSSSLRFLRDYLAEVMQKAGFKASGMEWWHFSLNEGAGYAKLNLPFSSLQ